MVRSRVLFQEQPVAWKGFTPGSTCPVPGERGTEKCKGRLLEQVSGGGSVLMERKMESGQIWGLQLTGSPDRSDMMIREREESQVDLRFGV